jgi:DNA-binding transcriptional MerR regulator
MIGPVDGSMTIDELARETGLTARNIRAYQSRGLLPPPEIRGRTGYYGPEHEARISSIRELQTAGFNLESIRKLLDAVPNASAEEALTLGTALLVPWAPEPPEVVDAETIVRRFGLFDADAIRRAEALGIVRALPDGRFQVDSPTLLRAGEQVTALGVPLLAALDVMEEVSRDADAVARTFVGLFMEHVWRPFEEAGRPLEGLELVRLAAERLNPIATTVLVTAFQRRMAEDIQAALGDELDAGEAGAGPGAG